MIKTMTTTKMMGCLLLVFAFLHVGDALQCWGFKERVTESTLTDKMKLAGILAEGHCVTMDSNAVDTTTCSKWTCDPGEACSKIASTTAGITMVYSPGCLPKNFNGCNHQTVTVDGITVEAAGCFCDDKDFCNSSIKMVSTPISLILAILATIFVLG